MKNTHGQRATAHRFHTIITGSRSTYTRIETKRPVYAIRVRSTQGNVVGRRNYFEEGSFGRRIF